jgi:hypothetical protein
LKQVLGIRLVMEMIRFWFSAEIILLFRYVNKQSRLAGVILASRTMEFIPGSLLSVSRTEKYIVAHLLVVLGQSKKFTQRCELDG